MPTLILTGDINLKGIIDPSSVFERISDVTRSADVVFGNLECCLCDLPDQQEAGREGFYAATAAADALVLAGFHAVGTANNVTYGDAAIRASLDALDRRGIAHTGSGCDRASAYKPAIVTRKGQAYGFVQRTSVYWPRNHEATDRAPGVAVLKGHTAYRPRIDDHAADRPGMAPEVVTWADPEQLTDYQRALQRVRGEVDLLVSSHHWGLAGDVLGYQREIAHAAIEAGADVVLGHGPHVPLGVEVYRGRPIFYGTGSFSFDIGHHGKAGDWIGYFVTLEAGVGGAIQASMRFVRRTTRNETVLRLPAEEPATVERLVRQSATFGTTLAVEAQGLAVVPPSA